MHAQPRRRLTVVHVLEAVGGGTARHLLDLVTHVADVRHVTVVPPRRVGGLSDDAIVERLLATGSEVFVMPMQRTPVGPRNVLAVNRLRRLLGATRPDIVHAHASIGGAVAAMAARGMPCEFVWTPHAVDARPWYAAAGRVLFRDANVVALSPSEAALLRRLRIGDPDRLHVIPNGVQPRTPCWSIDVRARFAIPAGSPILGTVGRLVPQKAPLDFVRACAHVAAAAPETRFVLVGEGPLSDDVDREVERLGLTGRFHRLRLPSDAAAVIGQFDVFMLASRYEGAPYTPLEAMVGGVPVVLTACVGSRDTVHDGHDGLLVPPGDTVALAKAALRVLDDDVLRARLSRNGSRAIVERFHVDDMASRYADLYSDLVKRSTLRTVRVPEVLAGFQSALPSPAEGAPVVAHEEIR